MISSNDNMLKRLFDARYMMLMDRQFFRNMQLEKCKTQEEKDRLMDRWQREDSATEIADAIRSAGISRRGLFGLF